ncbi:hypothetical protein AB0G02_40410 [Actinosynnema sp. NPDC023658]|uniref:hypothetical protein n=1 Tax=Actinosynnema sp. NPDC023658 TaxID=3155465 RepID=UPI003407F39B
MVVAAALAGPGQAVANAQVAAAADEQLPPTPGPVSPEQTNPQIFALTQDADYALRYSFAAVASDLGRSYASGTVEADLKAGLLSLPAEKRDPIVAVAKQLVTASANTRGTQFGRHGALTADQFRALGFAGAFASAKVDEAALKSSVNARAQQLAQEKKAAETDARNLAQLKQLDLVTVPKLTSLDFRIDRVKAVEETDEIGDDEIVMAGLTVDSAAVTKKVPLWMVNEDFDTGDQVDYADPGRLFNRFSLTGTGGWPRSFVAVVMMAEQDSGGFATAVNSAWTKVSGKVAEKIIQVVGDFLSEYVGAALGEFLGQVIGYLVGSFVQWVIDLFNDDLFDARTALVKLPHRYAFMYHDPADLGWTEYRRPTTQMRFVGHGGDYRVNVHWQVNL